MRRLHCRADRLAKTIPTCQARLMDPLGGAIAWSRGTVRRQTAREPGGRCRRHWFATMFRAPRITKPQTKGIGSRTIVTFTVVEGIGRAIQHSHGCCDGTFRVLLITLFERHTTRSHVRGRKYYVRVNHFRATPEMAPRMYIVQPLISADVPDEALSYQARASSNRQLDTL